MLYTDEYNVANLWSSSLNHYPLWIAEYDVITPSSLGPWENWSGLQHSDTGSINGIVGNVDLDYFKESAFITAEESPIPSETHPTPDLKPTLPPVISTFSTYIVQPGDTLSALALRFHTTVNTLVKLNHIMNPNLIYIGQVLKIPTSATKPSQSPFITYIVQAGNTLSGIAMRYNTTASALAALNNINNPNLIYVGQIIII